MNAKANMKKTAVRRQYTPPANDHISSAFDGLVPEKYRGTDAFLDVVTWNIRFFHDRDLDRVKRVAEILNALNADIIILQEIMGGSLDPVVKALSERGAGYYDLAYGSTGGNQRIAMMWDLNWVRSKDEVGELFSKGEVVASDGKDVFPRLPLRGYFTGLREDASPFDFQLLGVHLKSQRGGGEEQRELAAEKLAEWMTKVAPKTDTDVIVVGDFNAKPRSSAWSAFHELEKAGELAFQAINDEDDISHLMYRRKTDVGSRLDLYCLSSASVSEMHQRPETVRWTHIDRLLKDHNLSAQAIKDMIRHVSGNISDHMPVVTRFYFEEQEN